MPRDFFRISAAFGKDLAASSEDGGIRVHDLLIKSRKRDPDAVVVAWHGCEIEQNNNVIPGVLDLFPLSHKGEHAVFRIVHINPFKTGLFKVNFIQGRL